MESFLIELLGEEEVPWQLICLLDLISNHAGLGILKPMMMVDEYHKVSLGISEKLMQSLLTGDPLPYF